MSFLGDTLSQISPKAVCRRMSGMKMMLPLITWERNEGASNLINPKSNSGTKRETLLQVPVRHDCATKEVADELKKSMTRARKNWRLQARSGTVKASPN